jgi:predicted Zn-dependent peptidase
LSHTNKIPIIIIKHFKMKKLNLTKIFVFFLGLLLTQGILFSQKTYQYESVPGDPLNARIYTLDNGLKVYFSVYDEAPRIQTYVAVKVGGKNDPAETTGLAHYFEHLMFKGTPNFGTLDWEKEKVLLDQIEALFEIYRLENDVKKRTELYRQIDSISFIASKLAIPNEYDKLMTAIGSRGTNAGTSYDYTIYMENIPANQIENWAKIQADRFSNPVLRLFHTELETVYEEKNMSLTNDGRKAMEEMMKALYPNHPYGKQTILGEAEHLKNPSLKNIREFFEKYYIPNNMAVVMSGDFDPDETIKIVDRYFGTLKPSPFEPLSFEPEAPITEPLTREVTGLEAENVRIAWRFGNANSTDIPYINMISMILSNGKSGLIDINLNKKLLTLGAGASPSSYADYSSLNLMGRNKANQDLEEVRDLLMEQIEILKKGDFPDWLMEASINNLKLQEMRRLESITGRAMTMSMSFLNNRPYENTVNYLNELGKITKADIIAFANQHIRNDNYVVVYKRQGKPGEVEKIEKPAITPIHINREAESNLLKQIKAEQVKEIEPVFLDFQKDITRVKGKNNIEILYTPNVENATFSLTYFFRMGNYQDPTLSLASQYLNFLGTNKMTSEEISNEFYKLACSFSIFTSDDETRVSISGLSDNLEKAMILFEDLLWNAQPDQKAFESLVANLIKSREDMKANQRANFQGLVDYATYGPNNPFTYGLKNAELQELNPQTVLDNLRKMWNYEHRVVFYGPQSQKDIRNLVAKYHKTPKKLAPVPQPKRFTPLETTANKVFFAHYDANQSYLQTVSKGKKYDASLIPQVTLYNSYFGGGMNAIVFQELREKRGLAYTARSTYSAPSLPNENYINNSFIATQNDKVIDAFDAFNELFNTMPESEVSFNLSQESIISNIRTQRILKSSIVWSYLAAEKMGHTTDTRKMLFEKIPKMTLADVKAFNEKYIKDQPKTYIILGHEDQIDFESIEKLYGPVTKVSRDELFQF